MRPIIPNPRNDLRKIHDAIADLTKVVGEIKSMLKPEELHQQEKMNPWNSENTSTTNVVNQWVCSLCGGDTSEVDYDYIGSDTNHLSCELKQEIGSDEEG